jgi:hypothetical protein
VSGPKQAASVVVSRPKVIQVLCQSRGRQYSGGAPRELPAIYKAFVIRASVAYTVARMNQVTSMADSETRRVAAADGYSLAATLYPAGDTDTVVLINYGLPRLQHMGYFREGSEMLWQEATEWLDEVVPGPTPDHANRLLRGTSSHR